MLNVYLETFPPSLISDVVYRLPQQNAASRYFGIYQTVPPDTRADTPHYVCRPVSRPKNLHAKTATNFSIALTAKCDRR
jgi:hypothetical protein